MFITGKHRRNTTDGFNGNRSRSTKDKRAGINDILKLGIWNVRGLGSKEMELNNELKDKSINIAIISEAKKKERGQKIYQTVQ
jgi:hypothetical protein